jgi:phosphoglucomutase
VENWLQGLFNSLVFKEGEEKSLVIGGDGRYYNDVAIQKVLKVAIANGYTRFWVGQNGIISTPAVSAIIRNKGASGGIILTASHNPGGPTADFGIKYNISSGAPAPENVINEQYKMSQTLKTYRILDHADFPLHALGIQTPFPAVAVEVVDGVDVWLVLMKTIFDFDMIRSLFQRKAFSFSFDALHGVTGPYAIRLLYLYYLYLFNLI